MKTKTTKLNVWLTKNSDLLMFMNDAIKFADFGCLSSVGRFNELKYRSFHLSLNFLLLIE